MVPELEKPRVTEIQVRMDCNGCIQKIKKALHRINGIYNIYIDLPNQKLTIIGWADPEKIIKAIRKTRKTATICAHSEPLEPAAQPTEQAPDGDTPATDAANPPQPEAPQAEATPPEEPPKDPPPPENPSPEEIPSPSTVATDCNADQLAQPSGPKDVEEVHVIYHHPADYGYRYGYGGHWNKYSNDPAFPNEPPPPIYVTHSHNKYKPSPYITEYEYNRSPPQHIQYGRMEYYNEAYHNSSSSNGNVTSIFSDENPNACRIM